MTPIPRLDEGRLGLSNKLALNESVSHDESLAPEIDRELLRALARKQLSEAKARAVYELVHRFASWNRAHGEVLLEEFRRSRGETS